MRKLGTTSTAGALGWKARRYEGGEEAVGVVTLDLELESGVPARGLHRFERAATAAQALPGREERGRLVADEDEGSGDGDGLAAAPGLLAPYPHRLLRGGQAAEGLAPTRVGAAARADGREALASLLA